MRVDNIAPVEKARKALASGDVETAERISKKLVETPPGDSRAWSILAETALIRNRLDAAVACAKRAVAGNAQDAIAHIMHAKTLLLSGEIVDALSAAQSALPLIGDDPSACDALGAVFGLLGRHEQALQLSRKAVAADPENAQFLFNLAATERMTGMLVDAEAHCNEALRQNPSFAPAYYVRSDLRAQSIEDNHIEEIERLLRTSALQPRSEVMLRFALVKEYEDIGESERAFAQASTASMLWRKVVAYDPRSDLTLIQQIPNNHTAHWLNAMDSPHRDEPIFVCGLPRTGTTLVERIIASHSSVDSIGETNLFEIETLRRRDARQHDASAIGANYCVAARKAFSPSTSRFVDKTLENYLYCGLIHAALPKAKIILVTRGPMDTAWALFKAHFNGKFLWSYELSELADYYSAYRQLAEHWQRTLPRDAVMTIAYEDIVKDPRGQSAKIIDFVGLPWEEAVLRFYESRAPSATASAVQVRRPIYDTSLGRWRLYERFLAPFVHRLSQIAPHLCQDMM
jgi:tetratricopeptide (TPR) repeat protein